VATKNDITGDTIQTKSGGEDYADGWDRIFGDKNQKHKQQDLTELNGDGNRDRGRYGEDLFSGWEHYCMTEATLLSVEKGQPCNWCGLSEYEFDEKE